MQAPDQTPDQTTGAPPTVYKIRQTNPVAEQALEQSGLPKLLSRLYASRGVVCAHDADHRISGLLLPNSLAQADRAGQLLAHAIAQGLKMVVVADYDCDGASACAIMLRGLRMLGASEHNTRYLVPDRLKDGYGLTPAIAQRVMDLHQPALLITVDNGIASLDGVAHARSLGMQVLVTDHHLPAVIEDEDGLRKALCPGRSPTILSGTGAHTQPLPQAHGQVIDDGVVVVNPSQPGCTFASKALCGAGVAFYVLLATRAAQRAQGLHDKQSQPRLENLLDLVALATVADVVPLDANNRKLVAAGLNRMRAGLACAGINALFAVASRASARAASTDLGFTLGPRINAAGRLADMTLGIECLLTQDSARAAELAAVLHDINAQRRQIEAQMSEQAQRAMELAEQVHRYAQQEAENALTALDGTVPQEGRRSRTPDHEHSFDGWSADDGSANEGSANNGHAHRAASPLAIVVHHPEFHEGVIGIVAGRIKEQHHRPTFAFARSEHNGQPVLKGSGRSIAGFHLRDALDLVSKLHPRLIIKFGGHSMAAGVTIEPDGLNTFECALQDVASQWLSPEQLEKSILTDGPLPEDHYNAQTVEHINQAVWGQGFEAPIFIDRFAIVEQSVLAGKHLKLRLKPLGTAPADCGGPSNHAAHPDDTWATSWASPGAPRQAIWFSRNQHIDDDHAQRGVKLAYRLELNTWRDQTTVQMIVLGMAT